MISLGLKICNAVGFNICNAVGFNICNAIGFQYMQCCWILLCMERSITPLDLSSAKPRGHNCWSVPSYNDIIEIKCRYAVCDKRMSYGSSARIVQIPAKSPEYSGHYHHNFKSPDLSVIGGRYLARDHSGTTAMGSSASHFRQPIIVHLTHRRQPLIWETLKIG